MMLRVISRPEDFALSTVRALARQFRIIDEDDVVGALHAIGVTRVDCALALQEASDRLLISRIRGTLNLFRSNIFVGFDAPKWSRRARDGRQDVDDTMVF